jgi:hypothetical protein
MRLASRCDFSRDFRDTRYAWRVDARRGDARRFFIPLLRDEAGGRRAIAGRSAP